MAASCLWDVRAALGEGPLWSPSEGRLYFVDIKGRAIHALHLATQTQSSWLVPAQIGWLVPRRDGPGFVAGLQDGFAYLTLEPELRLSYLGNPHPDLPQLRLNDAKADPWGRIWAGSMHDLDQSQPVGRLYRLDPDGHWQVADSGYHICNGPALSLDGRTLYHTDSYLRHIYAYELDASGTLGNRRLWRQFAADEGSPDGMTVDAEGCLWVAHWGGGCVSRFSPLGELLKRIPLPVSQVSSCTFGGENLDRLFVTSARIGLSKAQLAEEPLAGGLFELDPGTMGLAAACFGG